MTVVNVDTFICFRASTPLVVALADAALLKRQLPNPKSWASLLALLAGVCAYTALDDGFSAQSYGWIGVWMAIFVADQVRKAWMWAVP